MSEKNRKLFHPSLLGITHNLDGTRIDRPRATIAPQSLPPLDLVKGLGVAGVVSGLGMALVSCAPQSTVGQIESNLSICPTDGPINYDDALGMGPGVYLPEVGPLTRDMALREDCEPQSMDGPLVQAVISHVTTDVAVPEGADPATDTTVLRIVTPYGRVYYAAKVPDYRMEDSTTRKPLFADYDPQGRPIVDTPTLQEYPDGSMTLTSDVLGFGIRYDLDGSISVTSPGQVDFQIADTEPFGVPTRTPEGAVIIGARQTQPGLNTTPSTGLVVPTETPDALPTIAVPPAPTLAPTETSTPEPTETPPTPVVGELSVENAVLMVQRESGKEVAGYVDMFRLNEDGSGEFFYVNDGGGVEALPIEAFTPGINIFTKEGSINSRLVPGTDAADYWGRVQPIIDASKDNGLSIGPSGSKGYFSGLVELFPDNPQLGTKIDERVADSVRNGSLPLNLSGLRVVAITVEDYKNRPGLRMLSNLFMDNGVYFSNTSYARHSVWGISVLPDGTPIYFSISPKKYSDEPGVPYWPDYDKITLTDDNPNNMVIINAHLQFWESMLNGSNNRLSCSRPLGVDECKNGHNSNYLIVDKNN